MTAAADMAATNAHLRSPAALGLSGFEFAVDKAFLVRNIIIIQVFSADWTEGWAFLGQKASAKHFHFLLDFGCFWLADLFGVSQCGLRCCGATHEH